jgi:hypothetical protein
MSEDASLDPPPRQISTQISQCKAILCGLDVNLQCSRCSAQQREDLRPEVILALNASVQVATHSLFVMFSTLAGLGHESILGSSAVSTIGITRQPSPSGFSSDGIATATNITSNLQNSARIIILPDRHVAATEGFFPQQNQHDRPSGASYGSRASSFLQTKGDSIVTLESPAVEEISLYHVTHRTLPQAAVLHQNHV